ncbi:MAG: L-2-amino-thiazoline-4-carboxylic acid hydrolase [Peptoniphilaceae bacterium]
MNDVNYKKEFKRFERYKKHLSKDEYTKSEEIYKNILKTEEVSIENKSHCYQRIFPTFAIYKAMKNQVENPLERTKEVFYQVEVYSNVNLMKRIFKIPYLYKLVPKIAYKTMKKSYKESDEGFQIDYLDIKKDILRFNIKQCLYFNYCKKFGVKELCDIFCTSDELAAQAMGTSVVFKRESTLARGGKYCDFCYKVRKNEEM